MHHVLGRLCPTIRSHPEARLLILVLVIVMTYQYFAQPCDHTVFIGSIRASDDPTTPVLLTNMIPIGFTATAIAFTLDQPMEFLASPNYLVYVRRPRTIGHFLIYLALLIAYCAVFCGIELAVGIIVVPNAAHTLTMSALNAMLTLLALLLMIDIGALAGNRIAGYVATVTSYSIIASVSPISRWCAQPTHGLLLFMALCAVCIATALPLFSRLEIR